MSFALVKSGTGIASSVFLSIANSTASPASTFFAAASVDGGGNSGWSIETAKPSTLTGVRYRSFQQGNTKLNGIARMGQRPRMEVMRRNLDIIAPSLSTASKALSYSELTALYDSLKNT